MGIEWTDPALAILESCVSDGANRMDCKREAIGLDPISQEAMNWSTKDSLGENDILKIIKTVNPTFLNYEEKLLVAIAAEFVWGKKLPEDITEIIADLRESLPIPEKENGVKLLPLERLWIDIITTDTDYF